MPELVRRVYVTPWDSKNDDITRTKAMGMHVKRYHCPWCEWWHLGNEPYKVRELVAG